jgi:hypothetical protein
MPFMGLPAWGAACVTGPVSMYTAAGFECSVGDKTFRNIVVEETFFFPNARLEFNDISPFISGNQFGLQWNLDQSVDSGGISGVRWSYDVSSKVPIIGAFVLLDGNTGGTGTISMSENLSNGSFLFLAGPGTDAAGFEPIDELHVIKENFLESGAIGFATTSLLLNTFSQVPSPIAGAGLPGLLLAGGGLLAWWRRRQKIG